MKVNANQKPAFQPQTLEIVFESLLEIVFESQKELDAFGALFNYSPIAETLRKFNISPLKIRDGVRELGGSCDTVFAEVRHSIEMGVRA